MSTPTLAADLCTPRHKLVQQREAGPPWLARAADVLPMLDMTA